MVVIRGPTAVLEKFNRIKAVIEGRAREKEQKGTGYFLSLQYPVFDNQERNNSSFKSLTLKSSLSPFAYPKYF